MSSERWLPVPGYEGSYEVSDMGGIRSVDRYVEGGPAGIYLLRGQVLKTQLSNRGRPTVQLFRNAKARLFTISSLVLTTFVGPRPDGMVGRHLNDVCTDNRLANLAYGTPSENMRDLVRNGRDPQRKRTHCPQGHPYDEANTYVSPSRPTARHCRACDRDRQPAKRARQKARRETTDAP